MDQRDETTWVVIELSPLGESKVEDGTLERTLRRDLGVDGDFPIFIPVLSYPKGSRTINIHLMEGYVFVATGLPDTTYFALERKEYVESVISTPGRVRTMNVVPNKKIQELRAQLRQMVAADIQVGSTVRVTNGPYRNLEGTTITIDKDNASVRFLLRSLDMIATIPLVFLDVLNNPEHKKQTKP